VFWLAAGIAMCYGVTGEEKYLESVRRALGYVLPLQKESGRFTTSYEIIRCEDWRPASSEASIAMFCLARILKYIPDTEYRKVFDKAASYVLSIQHKSGGIMNSDEEGETASLQDNRFVCDLVYTEGFALMGLNEAFSLTDEEKYKVSAVKLADFLVSIQCRRENPLWVGAWRGAYNPVLKRWEGRANQHNDIDEGGMYSVYTGWCCSTIMDGLLGVSAMIGGQK
jgi:rhamnogalacturonyl hydrolase YesR